MDDTLTLAEAMEDLVSAEDFLDYFAVPYDPAVVHVNRLHILQRFHDYLTKLDRAYQDFVTSDSLTEKVFAVFQNVSKPDGGMSSFVSLDKVFRQ